MMTHRVRHYSIWLFLPLVAWWAAVVGAADGSAMKLYNVKEGQITYQLTGPQTGTETFSFTEYGNKTRRETHAKMEMGGVTQQTDTVILTDGPWIYTLDPAKNEATKWKNSMYASLAEQGDLDRFKSGEDLMKALGGTVTGKDQALGHACEIWEIKQLMATTCITNDWFALWTKTGMGGMEVRQTATAIKIGPVPAGITSLAAGGRVVEGADPMAQLRQFQQQGLGGSARKKKSGKKPLTSEEMREAEKMREQFQGKDTNHMMESMKKMQEQFKQQGGAPGQ